MNSQDVRTIRGFVQALPKAQGKEEAAKVAIVAEDGTEYHIPHKGAGMDLVDFISADVEVEGFVCPLPVAPTQEEDAGEDVPRVFQLTVRSYQLADGYDDPWYDDES